MYKLITFGTLFVGLALGAGLTSVGELQQDDNVVLSPNQIDARDARESATDQPMDDARACEWDCQVCEADQGCTQVCSEIGDCGSACDMIAQCDTEHTWDEGTCACV